MLPWSNFYVFAVFIRGRALLHPLDADPKRFSAASTLYESALGDQPVPPSKGEFIVNLYYV